jgi:hypothetical protein
MQSDHNHRRPSHGRRSSSFGMGTHDGLSTLRTARTARRTLVLLFLHIQRLMPACLPPRRPLIPHHDWIQAAQNLLRADCHISRHLPFGRIARHCGGGLI